MALLERVSTLLRANLNDLLDKAEDPEKLSKQIILDMENQLLQVKTQVAVALADQHRLSGQQKEHEDAQSQWRRKAELAIAKGQDDLARAALERSLSHERLCAGFAQQCADQTAESESLRSAYAKLERKLTETRARIELLLAGHRRNRALAKAASRQPTGVNTDASQRLSRLVSNVAAGESAAQTSRTVRAVMASESIEDRLQTLEQEDQIESLLLELKRNNPRLSS